MSSVARIAAATFVCTLVASTLAEAQTRRETRTINVQPRSFLDPGKAPLQSGSGPNYVTMGHNSARPITIGAPFHSNTPFWGY